MFARPEGSGEGAATGPLWCFQTPWPMGVSCREQGRGGRQLSAPLLPLKARVASPVFCPSFIVG